jgi:hypothetical protein
MAKLVITPGDAERGDWSIVTGTGEDGATVSPVRPSLRQNGSS